jgi:heterotetrameric sarcosine oxidase gamma subunit
MSLSFLTASREDAGPLARSPFEHAARAAGARFQARGGWNVAVGYAGGPDADRVPVCWADAAPVSKLELQGSATALARAVETLTTRPPRLGTALRAAGAWWCPVTPERMLILVDADAAAALCPLVVAATAATEGGGGAVAIVDLTSAFAALTVAGPQAREAIARFCALDLRPSRAPVGAFRPGSVARTPGFVLREAEDRYLLMTGSALGHHLWTVVADAAAHLGGGPVAHDALGPVADVVLPEAGARA